MKSQRQIVLDAVNAGATTSTQIAAWTGWNVGTCSAWLSSLHQLGAIIRLREKVRFNSRGSASFEYTSLSKPTSGKYQNAAPVVGKMAATLWDLTYIQTCLNGRTIQKSSKREPKWSALLDLIVQERGLKITLSACVDLDRFRNTLSAMLQMRHGTGWSVRKAGEREILVLRMQGAR